MAGNAQWLNTKLTTMIAATPEQQDRFAEALARDAEGGAKQRAAVDTGFMRNSIAVEKVGPGQRRLFVGAAYGPFVEFGTWKMAAQPFVIPAVEATATRVPAIGKAIVFQ